MNLKTMENDLTAEGVDPTLLAVCISAGEMLYGEATETGHEFGPLRVIMKNPRRFLRLQNLTDKGMQIRFLLVDLDHMSEGSIETYPTTFYWVRNLGEEARERMYGLMLQYIADMKTTRAARAGLHLPESQGGLGIPPNLRPVR
jgi:hypothetical protein